MEQKTSLYDCHIASGGKMVPFAGYVLPVQYPSGVIAEHMAVRTKAGLFDVSHMGEILCTGPDALAYLNHLLTNDFTSMKNGQVRYSPMCNEQGGVVDDLLVYRYDEERYMLVVNAANCEKDFAWMNQQLQGNVQLQNISGEISQIALQGPMARQILCRLAKEEELPGKYYWFTPQCEVGGIPCMVSQTGYTGEHGYEIYINNGHAPILWEKLLEVGKEFGLMPCGLGARDTLRLEAAMPLYGHEMDDEIDPLETGLGFAVKLGKSEFIGKEELMEKGQSIRTRIGLKVTGRGIIREQAKLFIGDQEVGFTTSGTHCPYLDGAYAMALVPIAYSEPGTVMEAEVRGRRITAEVVALPFYQRAK